MAPTNGTNEDVIEKRDSSPVATAALVIAVVSIFAAISLQIAEVSEIRRGIPESELKMSGKRRAQKDLRDFTGQVETTLKASEIDENLVSKVKDIVGKKDRSPGTLWQGGGADSGAGGSATPGTDSGGLDSGLGDLGNLPDLPGGEEEDSGEN